MVPDGHERPGFRRQHVRVGPQRGRCRARATSTRGRDPSRDVFLTLPDGRRTRFTYAERYAGLGMSRAGFEAEPGVNVTLAVNGPDLIEYNSTLGFEYWDHIGYVVGDIVGEGGFAISDLKSKVRLPGYVMTLEDGTRVVIDKTQPRGDRGPREHALRHRRPAQRHLFRREGDVLPGRDGQQDHRPQRQPGRRDGRRHQALGRAGDQVRPRRSAGRIERVLDITPANPAGEAVLEYGYDSGGDLTSVKRLVEAAISATTPAKYATTYYNYARSGGASTHRLTSVTSPSGKTPIVNEYDAAGRLIATIDAFGKRVEYGHQIGQPPRGRDRPARAAERLRLRRPRQRCSPPTPSASRPTSPTTRRTASRARRPPTARRSR